MLQDPELMYICWPDPSFASKGKKVLTWEIHHFGELLHSTQCALPASCVAQSLAHSRYLVMQAELNTANLMYESSKETVFFLPLCLLEAFKLKT